MSPDQLVSQAKTKFNQALEHFLEELKKVRTGRAHSGMLDGVMVTAYETQMPLNQVGSVSTPEPQLLQISPFDHNNLQAIVKAVRDNPTLDMNPMDDGKVVRVQIPPLNEERRQEYIKIVGSKLEDTMVSMRNIRHEAMKEIDQAKKDKDISEDDAKRLQQQVDGVINDVRSQAESAARSKEEEIKTL